MTHPLFVLRAALGLSQPEYAGLVARTHAALGLGQMAARREKVSRWESGRTVPEHTAQLAMARIHGIPAREIYLLGWPHWLHLATGDAALLHQPHTDEGALLALAGSVHHPVTPGPSALLLTGSALRAQLRAAVARSTESAAHSDRPGSGPADEQLEWIETRVTALEQHHGGTLVPAESLYAAAHAEHRLVVHLLATAQHDHRTRRRLYRFAARTAQLCTWLCNALNEAARAERHALVSIRAAGAAGDAPLLVVAFRQLAYCHTIAGDPADALLAIAAARAVGPGLRPAAASQLHSQEALALARLGRADDVARALYLAGRALTATGGRPAPGESSGTRNLERILTAAHGTASLFLGRPHEAAHHFDAVAAAGSAPPSGGPSTFTGRWLLDGMKAHLAAGDVDGAARTVRRAVDIAGTLPPSLAREYHRHLVPHGEEPPIRRALDYLKHG
ncbi:hypothetical protein ACFVSN_44515 [Kitasatospora sp. NPDC057904]|uniref:hypothetical protein n=1 Tax=Kitasatospora sp. NPDC057904 TaxID=3346275 RepID=UPI0036DAAA68